MELPVVVAIVAFILVVVIVTVYLSIRVVQQCEKMVVFRLGKTNDALVRDPGLRFLIPVIDRPVKVDIRETFIEVPSQTTITKDNAPISVDFLIYWKIVDPLRSVVNAFNFTGMLAGVAQTTLRAVIGDILLDEVLSKREQINEVLRVKLDEVTERWGGKVTTVEIREITPPRDVQDAMNRQLSAERTRRAVITESEGSRQAAINVAEGQKQAEILKAEGDALGGEVIRLRSRDGLKLTARWLPAESGPVSGDGGEAWQPDPYEAILLLHGWTGSIAPDLVDLGPTLRRTAGVLGLDFRGHGGSDDAPTTFGLHEIEDVAGALAWLGERGIRRVALVGSSMGGAVALAAIVVLGDGSLVQADLDPTAPPAD